MVATSGGPQGPSPPHQLRALNNFLLNLETDSLPTSLPPFSMISRIGILPIFDALCRIPAKSVDYLCRRTHQPIKLLQRSFYKNASLLSLYLSLVFSSWMGHNLVTVVSHLLVRNLQACRSKPLGDPLLEAEYERLCSPVVAGHAPWGSSC